MEPSGAEAVSAPSLEVRQRRSDTATREQSINRIKVTLTGSERGQGVIQFAGEGLIPGLGLGEKEEGGSRGRKPENPFQGGILGMELAPA